MTLDSHTYRQTIGMFATGVTVVVAEVQGTVHAMTANAVTSLSLDPLLLLICVGKQARMAETLRSATYFTISILAEDQESASRRFAGQRVEPGAEEPRFIPWERGQKLDGSIAVLGCEPHEWIEGGDHWIVVGKVVALDQEGPTHSPLLFYQGKYRRIVLE